jgi:hypothetical protein
MILSPRCSSGLDKAINSIFNKSMEDQLIDMAHLVYNSTFLNVGRIIEQQRDILSGKIIE